MGLDDRDWYRERPSREWKRRWERSPVSPGADDAGTSFVRPGAWLAIAVSAVAIAVTWKVDAEVPFLSRLIAEGAADEPPSTVIRKPSREVHLAFDRAMHLPAAVAGSWSVSDPRFGTINVPVKAGEVPIVEIERVLSDRGFKVSVSGEPR